MENIKKQVRHALGFAPATLVSEANIKTGAPCVGKFPAISYQQEWKILISARCGVAHLDFATSVSGMKNKN
jgi:hypothetical protein